VDCGRSSVSWRMSYDEQRAAEAEIVRCMTAALSASRPFLALRLERGEDAVVTMAWASDSRRTWEFQSIDYLGGLLVVRKACPEPRDTLDGGWGECEGAEEFLCERAWPRARP
jgi:hypothetical protein